MTCGACLSLLQWSVDSAALIGYHVVNDVRCLMTCGACLSLLQWSVDSAALIGYACWSMTVPACHCYSGAWTVLP